MEEFVRYAMGCGLCFGFGVLSGIVIHTRMVRNWMTRISKRRYSHIVNLGDSRHDLFVMNEEELMKVLPFEAYSALTGDSEEVKV